MTKTEIVTKIDEAIALLEEIQAAHECNVSEVLILLGAVESGIIVDLK